MVRPLVLALGFALFAGCAPVVVIDPNPGTGGGAAGHAGDNGSGGGSAAHAATGVGAGGACQSSCAALDDGCACELLCGDTELFKITCTPKADKIECVCAYGDVFSGICFEDDAPLQCDFDHGCCAGYFSGA